MLLLTLLFGNPTERQAHAVLIRRLIIAVRHIAQAQLAAYQGFPLGIPALLRTWDRFVTCCYSKLAVPTL